MKSRGSQKSQISNSLVNWEQFGNATQANIKKLNFPYFSSIIKNWEVQIEQHSKSSKLPLWICTKMEVQPKTNTQKIPILNVWINWEKLCPNLSFTVEKKICIKKDCCHCKLNLALGETLNVYIDYLIFYLSNEYVKWKHYKSKFKFNINCIVNR